MSSFDLAAVFMALVAVVGFLNARFLRLPPGVAMLLVGLAGAGLVHTLQIAVPGFEPSNYAHHLIRRVNFSQTVVGYMLAFLLFAGGMQVDLGELRRRLTAVFCLATFGVIASTLLVGLGTFFLVRAFGLALPLPWAFVFGALISPTDPVAVLSTVREGRLPKNLQAILQGEALFNDGVGIVIFLAALAFATGGAAPSLLGSLGAVSFQAIGGLALGLICSWLTMRAMRAIDDYAVEVSISIALAAGVYAVGQALHVSGAIAAVAAGLIVGDHGVRTAMSDTTRRYLVGFWSLVDEILNALLFLLLGLELLVLPFNLRFGGLWLAIIPLVLATRLITVLPWGAYFHFRHEQKGPSLLLTWGGLRGALSLALALDVPDGPVRPVILSLTYAVVVFSVAFQGLTFGPLAKALGGADGRDATA
ncbi:MAG: cation:proton antiporter [Caulobacteraceae bacterium]